MYHQTILGFLRQYLGKDPSTTVVRIYLLWARAALELGEGVQRNSNRQLEEKEEQCSIQDRGFSLVKNTAFSDPELIQEAMRILF